MTIGRWMACVVLLAGRPEMAPAHDGVENLQGFLASYDAAFNSKDLARIGRFYDPDATIFEGGGVNRGWADYRDHHLGPELEEMRSQVLTHTNVAVSMLGKDGRAAYVTSEYRLVTKIGERDIDASGLETLVLAKAADGSWKIRHSHTSSRPRRPAASPSPKAVP